MIMHKDPNDNAQRSWVLLLNHHISNVLSTHLCSMDNLFDTGVSPGWQMIKERATAH